MTSSQDPKKAAQCHKCHLEWAAWADTEWRCDLNHHTYLRDAPKIGVFGSDADHCTDNARAIAYDVGKYLAGRNAIVFTGGGLGVMEAASRGATDAGGIAIGILAVGDLSRANPFCSLVIPTGIGFARHQILTNSVDGAILIKGGIGTLQEATDMYYLRKPIVAITSSGGKAAEIAGTALD